MGRKIGCLGELFGPISLSIFDQRLVSKTEYGDFLWADLEGHNAGKGKSFPLVCS